MVMLLAAAGCHRHLQTPDTHANVPVLPASNSNDDDGGMTPLDVGVAVYQTSCSNKGRRACTGVASKQPLICNGGLWQLDSPCDADQLCDTVAGADQGRCKKVAPECVGHAPNVEFCAGDAIRSCVDPFAVADDTCPAGATCFDSAGRLLCVCKTTRGPCDPLVSCSLSGGRATCGACPSGYADQNGDGSHCVDIDECATNNGGCGSAKYYSCMNQVGAAPICTVIDACTGTNICTTDYPCQTLVPGYTCLGQFADWTPADSPSTLTDNADGTVTDSNTRLMWQRSIDASTYNFSDAWAYCQNLQLAGASWRVPTLPELESIVDFGRANPAIDPSVFPNTPAEYFWSASPCFTTGGICGVYFDDGRAANGDTTQAYRVRCVH